MGEIKEEDWHLPEIKYEYLDHTADMQIHSWGNTVEEAFEQCANGMFGCMTDTDYIEMAETQEIEAEGHDMLSLLFHFLDEFLFLFSAEPYFVAKKVEILEFDKEQFRIKARGFGEQFIIGKHPQRHEVKAITYSNMQVNQTEDGLTHIHVIVDI
ncbi:hypothetical protein LSTR_LSTR012344 [Laodelphax striatellus]|uniref:Archease domain-containing protein n=1 Tax=Laodelphax striatellus TaxID=195883 RepID=A0A482XEN0_LAOST|nr:hypothetical protein LSTR_LSTR012344 [Laodelphax striatellus]